MAHYAQNSYAEIPGDNPSLVVAFCNLLLKLGHDTDPMILGKILTQDDEEIDWWSLPEYFAAIQYEEIAQSGPVWPSSSNAIVRLVREDRDTGESFEHYCLVADALAHSIIDSLDGKVKRSTQYGDVTGWATYSLVPDMAFASNGKINQFDREGEKYLVLENENIWDVVRKTKRTLNELLEHNGIVDGAMVKPGMELYIPKKESLVVEKAIEYEAFTEPHNMHIKTDGGARKWSFGNVKKWEDLEQTGPTQKQYMNLSIAGIARVPIGEDVAAYYLDSVSLGDFKQTGRVAFTTGYSWKDLEEGHYIEPTPAPVPVESEGEPNVEPEPLIVEKEVSSNPNDYKSTYKALDKPETYLYAVDVIIHEMDGRRPSKTRYRMQEVEIAGTFEKDGVTFARPTGAVAAGLWFGIPIKKLTTEAEVHRIPTELAEKIEYGMTLSKEEKVVEFLSRWISKYTHILDVLKSKISNINKE